MVEQLDSLFNGLFAGPRLDRAGVGLISGDELARTVPVPNRRRDCLMSARHGRPVFDLFAMALRQFGQLVLDPAQLAQPHYGASADNQAFGFHDVIGQRRDRHRKACGASAQSIDRTLHVLRGLRFEPAAER